MEILKIRNIVCNMDVILLIPSSNIIVICITHVGLRHDPVSAGIHKHHKHHKHPQTRILLISMFFVRSAVTSLA